MSESPAAVASRALATGGYRRLLANKRFRSGAAKSATDTAKAIDGEPPENESRNAPPAAPPSVAR